MASVVARYLHLYSKALGIGPRIRTYFNTLKSFSYCLSGTWIVCFNIPGEGLTYLTGLIFMELVLPMNNKTYTGESGKGEITS